MNKKIIYLIREDLRISDNPALSSAAQDGQVMIIYIHDTNKNKPRGEAYNWWTYHSLIDLNNQYYKIYGTKIYFYRGVTSEILEKLCNENNINEVYLNKAYDYDSLQLESQIQHYCKKFPGNLLHQPKEILNEQGNCYKIFTAYWKKARFANIRNIITAPKHINSLAPKNKGLKIDELNLLPTKLWYKKFDQYWKPGENYAKKALDNFIENNALNYQKMRDFPAIKATSSLSPFISHGEISVVEIFHKINEALLYKDLKDVECFLSELGWREFSYSLLYHFPDLTTKPIRQQFNDFQWDNNSKNLDKWKKGQTGYPIIDAGMRQMWETGWMHNRIRMLSGSFLTKDLLINWTEGENWFWDCLVDADYASNPVSWQWVAGCGCDAAPYFRIFNPITQSIKFDPEGQYIKTWIKELALTNKSIIHYEQIHPIYPRFIIDHKKARKLALIRFMELS